MAKRWIYCVVRLLASVQPGLVILPMSVLLITGCGAGPVGRSGGSAGPSVCSLESEPADCCPDGQIPLFTTDMEGAQVYAGCVADTTLLEDGNVDTTTAKPTGEPNDAFSEALEVVFDGRGQGLLQGSIQQVGDLDVYNLGILVAGDRVTVDVDSWTNSFDSSVALFDSDFNLFIDNDDENASLGQLDSHIEAIVRHDSDPYYLVIGHSAFAGTGQITGNYRITVTIESDQGVPPPAAQILFLDFDGGHVEPDNLLVNFVEPFDAGGIARIYAGQDELIMASVIETMQENYQGLNVVIITDQNELPADGEYTTIMFGSKNRQVFGISEAVDHYNSDRSDMAIIFTESFGPVMFSSTPSAEELGVAIGNIAAHEAGHLLGLNHVEDPLALMDRTSPADTFLDDQDFKQAPLGEDILPTGYQDALLLLAEIVGLL